MGSFCDLYPPARRILVLDYLAMSAHNYRRMLVSRYREDSLDLERMIEGLKHLDVRDLLRLRDQVSLRLQELGEEQSPVSGVLEYRPYADGTLQAEVRRYYRKDGSVKEQGPYWYFRYHEGGRQKKLYLGKTDDPESILAVKRDVASRGSA